MARAVTVTYTCNNCGRDDTSLHGGSVVDLDVKMRSYGWMVAAAGAVCYCPGCAPQQAAQIRQRAARR